MACCVKWRKIVHRSEVFKSKRRDKHGNAAERKVDEKALSKRLMSDVRLGAKVE